MIKYKETKNGVSVILEGKTVGTIKQLKDKGFSYFPKGSTSSGEIFRTVEEVKKTL